MTYKNVFNEVYTKGEADDPYKNLSPLYGELTAQRFSKKPKGYSIACYAAFVENEMVGVVEMAFDKQNAGLYALAVLPKYRKMGAARSLISKCIADARKNGIKNIFLQTEKGGRNEKIFTKFDFKAKFKGTLFYKD
jgi:N-acetylglutamate synthase-like GNAT family acetyltransferase